MAEGNGGADGLAATDLNGCLRSLMKITEQQSGAKDHISAPDAWV